jgi:hypothetical protein
MIMKKKRKMITMSEFELNQMLKFYYREGIKDTVKGVFAAMLITVHDKWGFGRIRSQRLLKQVEDQFDSIQKGYITVDDLVQTIDEELKIIM